MRLGLSGPQAVTVVLSTFGVYVTFLLLLRLFGQRALASMSSFDFAAVIALGAVMGRTVLGYTPTLAAGVLGMATLFVLQAVFGAMRRSRRAGRLMTNLPLLLMADGRVLHAQLRRAHIAEDDLRQKLRLAGVRRYGDVAAAILETTGAISVIRRGETLAPELVSDVRGHELLSRHVGGR